jgi:hypothetical protein
MNDRNAKPSAIAEEPHRIYSWEDVRQKDCYKRRRVYYGDGMLLGNSNIYGDILRY